MAAKKSTAKKTTAKKTTKKKATRRKKVAADSRGLTPAEVEAGGGAAALEPLAKRVESVGGQVLARYADPLGGTPLLLAVLPIAEVMPTPFQRDLSDAHAKRLADVVDKVNIFLDPVIAVEAGEASGPSFWTPNGLHRLTALQRMGARSITALVSPDPGLAYRILALNTEKAHNTKERSLEAVRMARGLADLDPSKPEKEYALELEDGSLITLGCAYEQRARFAGGAYAPALKSSDAFLDDPLPEALARREARAEKLLTIEDRVAEIAKGLKERGFDSPYLRNFVVARIRPFRPRGKAAPDADALLDHMQTAAEKFDVGKVNESQVAKTAGGRD
ncbi:MAG: chromosome partitioning protein ParB [Myxococcota bacterium]